MTEPWGEGTRTIHDGGVPTFFFSLKIYTFGYFFGLRSVMYFWGFISLFDRISQYCGICLFFYNNQLNLFIDFSS